MGGGRGGAVAGGGMMQYKIMQAKYQLVLLNVSQDRLLKTLTKKLQHKISKSVTLNSRSLILFFDFGFTACQDYFTFNQVYR